MPYTIDGQAASLDTEPQLHDGTMWVPLKTVGDALGGRTDWDPDNEVAILYLGSRMVTVKIGDPSVDIDGTKSELQAAPYLDGGHTWVPVRLFNQLGYGLNVDLGTHQVDFTNT